MAKEQKFSGSVLVAKGNQVLLSRAYREANVEWGIPNRPDTRFRLGSITKQFTAASVLLLADRGHLKLSDSIGQYLTNLPAAWRPVTIQQLLTHSSGIRSFTSLPGYEAVERQAAAPGQVLATVRDLALDFEPGTRFDYSNSGYVLLGMLIEKISGDSYAQFLQKNVFDPLRMRDSGYDTNTKLVPRRASGYQQTERGLDNAGYIDMSVPYAAGGLYSTTSDLLRWQRALYEGKLLSADSLRAMTSPFLDHYALGLFVQDGPDGKQFGHGGNIEGFSTAVAYRPAERISVILLSNVERTDLGQLERALFQVALGRSIVLPAERKAISLGSGQLNKIAGLYLLPDGTKFRVKVVGKGLDTRRGADEWIPFFAEGENRFFARKVDAQLDVLRSAEGYADALALLQDGNRVVMRREVDKGPDFAAVPLYLRGEMNDWGVENQMRKEDANRFAVTLKLDKRHYSFKLGSEDFKAIDFGGLQGKSSIVPGQAVELEEYGGNLDVDIREAGNYRFVLELSDGRAPKLEIKRID